MKITNYVFFGKVGIVRVIDEYEGEKFYIRETNGVDLNDDVRHVAQWGSTFPQEAGQALLKNMIPILLEV